jgi:hypothetical protein
MGCRVPAMLARAAVNNWLYPTRSGALSRGKAHSCQTSERRIQWGDLLGDLKEPVNPRHRPPQNVEAAATAESVAKPMSALEPVGDK